MQSQKQLSCQYCQQVFNLEDNKPILLQNCGHLLCQQCLQEFHLQNVDIICEFDGIQYSVNNIDELHFPICPNTVEILQKQQSFKKNLLMKNNKKNLCVSQSISMEIPQDLISLSKSFSDISSIDKNQSSLLTNGENSQNKICVIHQKKMKLICHTCQQTICFQCGLFGQHQNHTMESIEEFLTKIFKQKNEYKKYFQKIQEKPKKISQEIGDIIVKDFQDKQNELEKNLEIQTNNLIKKINEKKQEILIKIKENISYQQDSIQSQMIKLNEGIQSDIEQRFFVIEKFLNTNENNSNSLIVDLLKNKLPTIKEIKEIYQEYSQQQLQIKNNAKNTIKKMKISQHKEFPLDFLEFKSNSKRETKEEDQFDITNESSKILSQNSSCKKLIKNKQHISNKKQTIQNPFKWGSSESYSNDDELLNDINKVNVQQQNFPQRKKFESMGAEPRPVYFQSQIFDQIQGQSLYMDLNKQKSIQNLPNKNQSNSRQNIYTHQITKKNNALNKTDTKPLQKPQEMQCSFLYQNWLSTKPVVLDVDKLIQKAFKNNTGVIDLRNLQIRDNNIKTIEQLSSLQMKNIKLNLSNNLITDQGIKQICSIFYLNCPKEIDISGNNVTYKSFNNLLKLSVKNSHLKKIVLKNLLVDPNRQQQFLSLFDKTKVTIEF